mmetsp:Transcript_6182/g.9373  ORF Transcript_6182/g.9373 Transcript_6182/m.9373 type:complete len:701 (-) Transcript_6182:163-2265(-)
MDSLQQYASSDEEGETTAPTTATATATNAASSSETTTAIVSPVIRPTNTVKRSTNIQPAPQPSTLAMLQLATFNNPHNKNNTNNGIQMSNNNKQLMNNPKKSTLLQPIQGPNLSEADDTLTKPTLSKGLIATDISHNTAFDHATFEMQRNAFQRDGVALGPDDGSGAGTGPGNGNQGGGVVQRGNYGHGRKRFNKETNTFESITVKDDRFNDDDNDDDDNNNNNTKETKSNKRKRMEQELVNDSDDEINYGIWGPPTEEMKKIQANSLSTLDKVGGVVDSLPEEMRAERAHLVERNRRKGMDVSGPDGMAAGPNANLDRENQNFDKMVERKMAHLLPPRIDGEEAVAIDPTTKLHLPPEEEFNYKGESWIACPTELRSGLDIDDSEVGAGVDHHKCYVPKKCTARFLGHNKGVHRIRLFPRTGHLLLSAGLDGKCKVWSVMTKKVCRTYIGHSAAVRDVQFNNDGTKFLSCSFDRFIRLWDTEKGDVLGTYTNRRVPYVLKFFPKDDNIFVVGCSDNKIVAYDSTSGEVTQEYNHHLAPVNTITFVEDHGMKMITSSDDKKILVWEWDIGVPIKYISDPTMHSIPVVTLHPTGNFFAGQSLDNQIVVYQGKDRFAVQRKKKFSGHLVSGYACDIAFSPDGQFICSGDGNGKLFFWDWRRSKILQKYRAHDKGPTIGSVWHPVLPSTVFTCGWDGVIKMWE